MKEMKILSIGGKLFEVVDSAARELISSLTTGLSDLTTAVDNKVSKESYNPVEATTEMTQPVGVDADGKLFTAPSTDGVTDVQLSATDDSAGNVTITVTSN